MLMHPPGPSCFRYADLARMSATVPWFHRVIVA